MDYTKENLCHAPSNGAAKPASRTAQALDMVAGGMLVRDAARMMGIKTQSIYRLQKYRASRKACETCGRPMKAKK